MERQGPEAVLYDIHAVGQAIATDGRDATYEVHSGDVAAERSSVICWLRKATSKI